MHKKHLHEAPDTSTGYEQTDLDIGSITKGVTIFFGFAIFVAVVVMAFFWFKGEFGVPPVGSVAPLHVPKDPNPVLQNYTTARTDVINMRAKEDDILSTYGWIDQPKGIARIPIEDAIKLDAALGAEGNRNQPFAAPATNGALPTPANTAAKPLESTNPRIEGTSVPKTGQSPPTGGTNGL